MRIPLCFASALVVVTATGCGHHATAPATPAATPLNTLAPAERAAGWR